MPWALALSSLPPQHSVTMPVPVPLDKRDGVSDSTLARVLPSPPPARRNCLSGQKHQTKNPLPPVPCALKETTSSSPVSDDSFLPLDTGHWTTDTVLWARCFLRPLSPHILLPTNHHHHHDSSPKPVASTSHLTGSLQRDQPSPAAQPAKAPSHCRRPVLGSSAINRAGIRPGAPIQLDAVPSALLLVDLASPRSASQRLSTTRQGHRPSSEASRTPSRQPDRHPPARHRLHGFLGKTQGQASTTPVIVWCRTHRHPLSQTVIHRLVSPARLVALHVQHGGVHEHKRGGDGDEEEKPEN